MLLQQILAQLVAKFPGVSKQFLALLAAKMVAKVTEESQIQGAIDELDNSPIPVTDLAKEFQKEGDRRVTEAKKEFQKNPPKPDNGKNGKTEDAEDPGKTGADEMPPWFKKHVEQTEAKFAAMEKEKRTGTMKERLAKELKDVPEVLWKRISLPEKEEDFDTFLEELKTEFAEYTDSKNNEVIAGGKKPVNGKPAAGGDKVDADLVNIVKSHNQKATQTAKN